MSAFSTKMKAVASSLLTTYGQTITFTRWSTTEYNTTTGGVEPVSSTTFSGVCHPTVYRLDEIDGETIQTNDIKAIVYVVTEPLIQDEATIDNVKYRIMNVEKVKAQGETIVYNLQLRV